MFSVNTLTVILTPAMQVADRYKLTGDVLNGQMDLDILNVRQTDSGPFCCRVGIDGIFNDKKTIMNLRVVKGETNHLHSFSILRFKGAPLQLCRSRLVHEQTYHSQCCGLVMSQSGSHITMTCPSPPCNSPAFIPLKNVLVNSFKNPKVSNLLLWSHMQLYN